MEEIMCNYKKKKKKKEKVKKKKGVDGDKLIQERKAWGRG